MIDCYKSREIGENSWIVKVEDIKDYDLSAKNPNKNKEEILRDPKEILEDIEKLDNEIKVHIQNLKGLLK
jgi:type I restriction enzyme M protein